MLLVYSLIALTVLAEGAVVVVRGIMTEVWEPDRDAMLAQYIFGSFIGYSLLALSIAWQIRSRGNWSKGLPLTVAVLTMCNAGQSASRVPA